MTGSLSGSGPPRLGSVSVMGSCNNGCYWTSFFPSRGQNTGVSWWRLKTSDSWWYLKGLFSKIKKGRNNLKAFLLWATSLGNSSCNSRGGKYFSCWKWKPINKSHVHFPVGCNQFQPSHLSSPELEMQRYKQLWNKDLNLGIQNIGQDVRRGLLKECCKYRISPCLKLVQKDISATFILLFSNYS